MHLTLFHWSIQYCCIVVALSSYCCIWSEEVVADASVIVASWYQPFLSWEHFHSSTHNNSQAKKPFRMVKPTICKGMGDQVFITGFSEGAVNSRGVDYLSPWLSVFVTSCTWGSLTINNSHGQSGSIVTYVCFLSLLTFFSVVLCI